MQALVVARSGPHASISVKLTVTGHDLSSPSAALTSEPAVLPLGSDAGVSVQAVSELLPSWSWSPWQAVSFLYSVAKYLA